MSSLVLGQFRKFGVEYLSSLLVHNLSHIFDTNGFVHTANRCSRKLIFHFYRTFHSRLVIMHIDFAIRADLDCTE